MTWNRGRVAVKKKRFTVELIVGILKQAEVGVPVRELVRFYNKRGAVS